MKRLGLCVALLGVVNCMGVQVPEDYIADVYYGQPKLLSVSASASSASLSAVPIEVTFSNPMDASGINVNTTDAACTASIQVSKDNFTSCLQFAAPLTSTTRDSVFTATLVNPVNPNSNYLVRALGTISNFRGTALGTDQDLGFKTGIPAGSEPTGSVTGRPKVPATGANVITVSFSRTMSFSSIASSVAADCNSHFVMIDDTDGNCVNPSISPTGDASAYNITFSLISSRTYHFYVRTGLIDQFAIATVTEIAQLLP